MATSLPQLLSLLVMSLGAALIAYVVTRRPREPSSWALACAAAGVWSIYLSEFFLYSTPLSVGAGFFWQKVMTVGAGVAVIGAVALALALRETAVPRWERWLAILLILRAIADIAFIVALRSQPQPDCLGPWGTPMLHCGPAHRLGASIALLSIPPTLFLYYRAFRLASNARRRVFIAYLLPAVLLVCLGSTISILWGLRAKGSLFPTGIIVAPAAAFAAAGLLHLEGTRAPRASLRRLIWLLGWTGLMAAAVAVDARWLSNRFPLAALLTLIGGMGAALAYMARRASLATSAAAEVVRTDAAGIQQRTGSDPDTREGRESTVNAGSPFAVDSECVASVRLRIRLFGPFLVERNGEALPNQAKFWRSDKSRSLLAYLALAGEKGLTRGQLVDALWPLPDDEDGKAEQRSLNALRSYLSTLRKVLEPGKPRGADSLIAHDRERYRLAKRSDLWVDVWEFARLAADAERFMKAGDPQDVAIWEQAIALHGELGLLPDEEYLPLEVVEPIRERLRQQWLRGARRLARHYSGNGSIERAVTLWDMVLRAVPLDAEAYNWLRAHYRSTGQAAQAAALEEGRRRAAAEIGSEQAT